MVGTPWVGISAQASRRSQKLCVTKPHSLPSDTRRATLPRAAEIMSKAPRESAACMPMTEPSKQAQRASSGE